MRHLVPQRGFYSSHSTVVLRRVTTLTLYCPRVCVRAHKKRIKIHVTGSRLPPLISPSLAQRCLITYVVCHMSLNMYSFAFIYLFIYHLNPLKNAHKYVFVYNSFGLLHVSKGPDSQQTEN
uniref:Uncharacterized protein n=1 Tax=Trypanosoma congolense (strain IL3000) TaxID=1068625 RepID=G0UKW0_TRYCI|nr:hypothetical protein, unlikely [Trypanosoma congolense IL3000]